MKHILFSLLFTIVHLSFFAQEKQPTISGQVKISILEGTFDCDLTLSNIPDIKDYLIRLNAGMNLLQMRSKAPNDFVLSYDKSKTDSMSTGESFAYFFPNQTGKFLPESIQFRYVGKFPVATDTLTNYSRDDWKGNIAFNGYSVRTDGFQTAWYPYIYDAEKDVSYEKMSYDIDIECLDCSTIYVNGNKPVRATKIQVKSDVPYELALFCGKYDFVDDGKLVMLNPSFSKKDLADFSELIATYKTYYELKLAIPFSESPVFVNTTPTSIYNGWLFVTYPTIMGIGWGNNGLGALFEKDSKKWFEQFIAHELGHYYFGTVKVFNSELGDMLSEGFAEFLSLKLVEELQSKKMLDKIIDQKFEQLKEAKFPSISKIKSVNDIQERDLFVYCYGPVIFSAIEKEIGTEKMWKWISTILSTKVDFTNYVFVCSTLKQAINDEQLFQHIEATYFISENALENAKKKVLTK